MCIEVPPELPADRLPRVWLTPDEIKGGYLGYANQVLWPLCHITLDRINYLKAFWPAYRSEMHRFARRCWRSWIESRGRCGFMIFIWRFSLR